MAAVCLSAAFLFALALLSPSAVSPSASAQGGATPTPTPFTSFVRRVDLTASHIAYNAATQAIFATVPSRVGAGGNSVVQITPSTGAVGAPVWVGSEPGRMAFTEDWLTMYVALVGARAVRRFDVATQTPGFEFSTLSLIPGGPGAVTDIAVMPGRPQTVAVGRSRGVGSPSFDTAIFDDGVQRPQVLPAAGHRVHFGASPSRLYTTSFNDLRRAVVSDSGLTQEGGEVRFCCETEFDRTRGLLFSSAGAVINAETGAVVANLESGVSLEVDSQAGRVYYISTLRPESGVRDIVAYDINTFQRIGHTRITGIPDLNRSPADLVRWGTNGLAFRVPAADNSADGEVFVIQTQLVDPSPALPAPTPVPTPSPMPTPNTATFVRRVGLPAGDVVYNDSTLSLYASVGSAAGAAGNSVVPINPSDGAVGTPVAVGPEPGMLALADDGRALYVHLDGANAVRRVDLQAMTAGLRFTTGANPPFDMEVVPGSPQSLAVSRGFGSNDPGLRGVAVFDDGVQRPKTGLGTHFEFASPTVYHGESVGTALSKNELAADGFTTTSTAAHLATSFPAAFASYIDYAAGRVYYSHGPVADPEAKRIVGSFDGVVVGVFVVDAALGRVFFLSNNLGPLENEYKVLKAYDIHTFLPLGSVVIPMRGTPTRIVRWGANGLAVRTRSNEPNVENRAVYLIQSALVSPSAPVPAGVQLDDLSRAVVESATEIDIAALRTGDLSQTTSVPYATADGTATAGGDYAAASGTLTFAPGQSAGFVRVQLNPDSVHEGHETLTLTLGAPSGGELVGPASAQVTILDDDQQPTINIADVRVAEGHAGTRDAEFLVTLSNPSTGAITFNYVTGDGTATTPSDYEGTSGFVTLPPLATSAVIKVKVVGDTQVEPDETFTVSLSTPTNATFSRSAATATIVNDEGPTVVRFARDLYAVGEQSGQVVVVATRSGDLSAAASVNYATSDGTAAEVSDYTLTLGALHFAAGEVEKSFPVLITDDEFAEQQEDFTVTLSSPTGAALDAPSTTTVTIVEDDLSPGQSPVAPPGFNPEFFVRQHYHDFLNREPDAEGLAFWAGEFTQCKGGEVCLEVKRVNVSAAFFLSIEFQETGYLVYRLHQAAFDTHETLRWRTFLADTQEIGRGVQVGVGDWQARLDANKSAFVARFAASPAFAAAYQGMTNAQYVDALNANTYDPLAPGSGGALTRAERDALVADLNESRKTRAEALRAVAEHAEFARRQFNRAFVLMEYFGYLRRNPDDPPDGNFDGFSFWLGKLQEFGGNYVAAEMVRAFITSAEYRRRFGP